MVQDDIEELRGQIDDLEAAADSAGTASGGTGAN